MLISLAALIVGYALGSLPLGGRFVAFMSGQNPATTSAHNLGVENLLRFVGVPAAAGAFLLDALKAVAALALFGGSPWAALGVYAGHLYPAYRWRNALPRGRGNGVLLGVLIGFWAYAGLPYALTLLPLVVFAATLLSSRYVALATSLGLLSLLVLPLGAPPNFWLPLALLAGLGLWRQKVSLTRILDRTEARFGEPPPVRGTDAHVVYAAFMIHPITLDDLWQPRSVRWLKPLARRGLLPEGLVRLVVHWTRPQKRGELSGVTLADGRELRVMLIGGSMLPDQIRRYPDEALHMAIQGARLAHELGAEAFGLGAFWSTVGDKGLRVQEAVPELPITNGGAYTAATVRAALPGLLERFEASGRALRHATAAVVGANGVVAFGVARLVAPEVETLILIGRDAGRLARSARTLERKYPQTNIVTTTDLSRVQEADLVFSATSDPEAIIFAEHIRPGAWLFDLGRPADIDPGVRTVPGVQLIPGGVVRPPGAAQSAIDMHFGDGLVPACLAETMIMTASRAFGRKSLGERTKDANIAFYLEEGARLGFEIVTEDPQGMRDLQGIDAPAAAEGVAA